MQYEIINPVGGSVRVEAANWLMALGKSMVFFDRDPLAFQEWHVATRMATQAVEIRDEEGTWSVQAVPEKVAVMPVGPREIITSVLPDMDDDPRVSIPPPMLRMPTSVLAPPMESLFDKDDFVENLFVLSTDLVGARADESCRMALDLILRFVPCEASVIHRGTVNDDGLTCVAARGPFAERVIGDKVPFGTGLAGLAHDVGIPVKLDDTSNDGRHLGRYFEEFGFRTRAILCVPVLNPEAVFGVVQLINPDNPFSPEDVEAVSQVATTLANALAGAE